jgi:hypothetical protein
MSDFIPSPHAASRFRQQELPASRPFFMPHVGSILCAAVSVISLIVGTITTVTNNRLFSITINYGAECGADPLCNVSFTIPQNVTGPLFIFYSLTNFYQSTYLYSASKSWPQLRGKPYNADDISGCAPGIRDGSDRIYLPCGLVPRSVFNDTFIFPSPFPEIDENNTAQSQFQDLFQERDPSYNSLGVDILDSTVFRLDQKDDRFVTWMDIAPFSTFQKLWGEIKSDSVVQEGEYELMVHNNFPVDSFGGTKSLIISQVIWTGGRNAFFGIAFFVLSGLGLVSSIGWALASLTKKLPLYAALNRMGISPSSQDRRELKVPLEL